MNAIRPLQFVEGARIVRRQPCGTVRSLDIVNGRSAWMRRFPNGSQYDFR